MTQVTTSSTTRSFTTVGLPVEQQLAMWQAYNSEALMGLRCRALSNGEFIGATLNLDLDATKLARIRARAPHVIERTPEFISRHPRDSVVFFFGLSGEAFFYHPDGVRQLNAGQLVVCDTARPFMAGFSNDFAQIFLKIPRHAFFTNNGLEKLTDHLLF